MGRDRGQTQQDFAVGVSVFLLAALFVFAFVPTTISPGSANVEAKSYQADRTANAILANISVETSANVLNETETNAFFTAHDDSDDITSNYSLPTTTKVNVTIQTLQGIAVDGDNRQAGDPFLDRPDAAAATRIVWLNGVRHRLVVRVW